MSNEAPPPIPYTPNPAATATFEASLAALLLRWGAAGEFDPKAYVDKTAAERTAVDAASDLVRNFLDRADDLLPELVTLRAAMAKAGGANEATHRSLQCSEEDNASLRMELAEERRHIGALRTDVMLYRVRMLAVAKYLRTDAGRAKHEVDAERMRWAADMLDIMRDDGDTP
jgi:hypothetical protein